MIARKAVCHGMNSWIEELKFYSIVAMLNFIVLKWVFDMTTYIYIYIYILIGKRSILLKKRKAPLSWTILEDIIVQLQVLGPSSKYSAQTFLLVLWVISLTKGPCGILSPFGF
jgi:hypothetical protein